jgi:Flp pilus assembly protein TadD
LQPFPYSAEAANDARDLGLAWESIAGSGVPHAESEAERQLKVAAKSPDPAVLSAIGYLEQKRGNLDAASKSYREALEISPGLIDVENNLASLDARTGHTPEAVTLWEDAFQKAPGRSTIGMNLALRSRYLDCKCTVTVLVWNVSEGPLSKLIFNRDTPSFFNTSALSTD